MTSSIGGPLHGLRVVELAALGPAPFAGMVLADLGADVVLVDRADSVRGDGPMDVLRRGRRSIAVDLKHADGPETVLRLLHGADVLIEGFRPGVLERLGLGPAVAHARNPRLVIGRMTGWGQEGPLAATAGHDIDYIALAGALHPIGRAGSPPVAPLNLVGDFGGGGMLLVAGILAALLERARSGLGQVVDAAMVDGASLLMAFLQEQRQVGLWSDARASNYIDTAAPYYDTYETADGRFLAVGAIEPQFYAQLLDGLEIDPAELPDQEDRARWPETKERFAAVIAGRTRARWVEVFAGTDACVAPVLEPGEVIEHPHNRARAAMVLVGDRLLPAPAPRFDRTPPATPHPGPRPGADGRAILAAAGHGPDDVARLIASGAVVVPEG